MTPPVRQPDAPPARNRSDFIPAAYYLIYMIYLWFFVDYETEWLHWLTLVLLPLAGMAVALRVQGGTLNWTQLADRIGVRKATLTRGLWQACLIGLTAGSLQLLMSRQKSAVLDLIGSGAFFYKFPLAFGLMLVTAAFTEEFFFRGMLQSSLTRRFGSPRWGNIAASIAFGVYHLPYAYMLQSWPSHGNLVAAISEGVVFSAVIGLVLGAVYNRYRNLLAPIIVHAAFNAVWAVTIV